jgi:NAD dependent epimerase/dehydratase family enzyme
VTNSEFTLALARALHRPAPWRIPAFLLRGLLGEMAEEMLLSSARVLPQKLLSSGFSFSHPLLADALMHVLRSSPRTGSE